MSKWHYINDLYSVDFLRIEFMFNMSKIWRLMYRQLGPGVRRPVGETPGGPDWPLTLTCFRWRLDPIERWGTPRFDRHLRFIIHICVMSPVGLWLANKLDLIHNVACFTCLVGTRLFEWCSNEYTYILRFSDPQLKVLYHLMFNEKL